MSVPFVRTRGLTRRYAGVVALEGVDFQIDPGEVIGLIGKNGAGKSTLIRLLAGVEHADEGTIELSGAPVSGHHTPALAGRHGLAFMHQELANVSAMTVAENVALGSRFPRRLGVLVDWPALRGRVAAVLSRLELDVDPAALVSDLTMVQQRMVMIARALYHDARVLVLDEPSTSLTETEIDHLHRVIRTLRNDGRSVVYVSHRLKEISDITDRIVVMQDGRVTLERPTSGVTEAELVDAIAGGSAPDVRRIPRSASVIGAPILKVRDLARRSGEPGISFDLNAGEILGIAGLVGSGRTELARMIFAADARGAGTVDIDGRATHWTSPRDAIRGGVALLPEDRRHQGLVLGMSVRENITLASLARHRVGAIPVISKASETDVADRLVGQISIKTPGVEQQVRRLSGGNQQKVVLAKWLARGGRVFIFDEPTQGVDVHAKEEIFALIRQSVADGRGAIVISSDLSELVAIADRVIALREGKLTGTLAGGDIDEAAIVRLVYAS
jgi:ABC-type sugar transport system ATPase subunit